MRLGITIGEPNGPGQAAVCDLYGSGAPTAQVVDPTVMNVASCAVGSTYRDVLNAHFYFKTAMPASGSPNGTWVQVV
jgi:hypothetical protein